MLTHLLSDWCVVQAIMMEESTTRKSSDVATRSEIPEGGCDSWLPPLSSPKLPAVL
jgi:hypothetical protein